MSKKASKPLDIEYINPNTPEETADFLIKLLAKKLVQQYKSKVSEQNESSEEKVGVKGAVQ